MRHLALIAVLTAGALTAQDMPEQAVPTPQHEWLQQLVGAWTVTMESSMGPDTEPMKMESTENVRSLGGLWILSEGSADFAGKPFTSILTLGYDPAKKAFVGTWIDTMTTHLWVYRGSLNPEKTVLTLEAEGPSFDDPTKMAKYRDAFEIKGPDHKVLTSSVHGPDGAWTTFMRADFRRVK